MIDNIHEAMNSEFSKRKIQPYSSRMSLKHMCEWSDKISSQYSDIDQERLEAYVKEIYWGASSLQLNVGYTLIALRQTTYPSGAKVCAKSPDDLNRSYNLADIHYWYHISHCRESLYRMWERIVSVLEARFTPQLKKKFYFDSYVNYLSEHQVIPKPDINSLKHFLKTWNKISEKRNEISHGKINPFRTIKVNVEPNGLIDKEGNLPLKASYEYPNFKEEVNTLINYGEKTFELINLHIKICEQPIKPISNKKGS